MRNLLSLAMVTRPMSLPLPDWAWRREKEEEEEEEEEECFNTLVAKSMARWKSQYNVADGKNIGLPKQCCSNCRRLAIKSWIWMPLPCADDADADLYSSSGRPKYKRTSMGPSRNSVMTSALMECIAGVLSREHGVEDEGASSCPSSPPP